MEESFIALLQALEKIPVDDEKLTSCGLRITLKNLIVHSSPVIKERVNTLLESWKLHMKTTKVDVHVKEDMSVDDCTKASIKSNEISLDMDNESKSTSTGHNSSTPDPLPTEKVKDLPNAECSIEVGTAVTLDHEAVDDGNSVTPHSTDLCIVKENGSITGAMSADADKGFTNTRNESCSNSKREEEVGSLEQNIEILADVGSGENGITTTSIEHSREDEQPSTSSFPETEGSSLRSEDAKAEKPATKAAQKDTVMVSSEGMDIPELVRSSSQEKMIDGPTEQLFKSLPHSASSGQEFSSDSIIEKAEDNMDGIEPSHVNGEVQETEIKTRAVLGFDLNEEVFSEDVDSQAVPSQGLNCDKIDHQVINQTSMATSVISASRPAAVSGLPAGRLQFEGTLGWKGSAATSAFRLASPRKPLESNVTSSTGPSSNSLNQRHYVHDFDLNMADDENAENNTPDSIIAVSSSHPSEESCVEIGPHKSKRAELDLNSLRDAPPSAYWSMNGLPFSQQNAYRSPSPASSSSSVHPSMWDLDLNKKFSMPNFPHDPPPYPGTSTFNFIEGHGVRKPAASELPVMGARVDIGKEEPFFQSPLHPNANITGFRSFLPLSMNPSQPLQSFMYRPGIPITMFDPRSSSLLPHMIGPAQPPYLMNMISAPPQAPISIAPPYPTFDPNNILYMNDAANRNEPQHTRQYLMSTRGGFPEPHSSTISQPSPFLTTKRKEPHSGWGPYQHGFKHHEPHGNT